VQHIPTASRSISLDAKTPMAVISDNIQYQPSFINCQPWETANNRDVNNFLMRCRTANQKIGRLKQTMKSP